MSLNDIHIHEKYQIYNSEPDQGLNQSLMVNDVIEPLTVLKSKEEEHILINGFRRYDFMIENDPSDKMIPVWVIEQELTDDEIHMLILDLARVRQKGYAEILNEYHLYDKILPNNQGKKGVEKHRIKEIADRIGVSVSTLRRLISIDRINPALLVAVDSGIITLSKAKVDAKNIERERKKADETFELEEPVEGIQDEDENSDDDPRSVQRSFKDKIIDLNVLPNACPSCNRSFYNIEWEEIPEIFNLKRKPEEAQIDWLQKIA
jgi:hypothetical protein